MINEMTFGGFPVEIKFQDDEVFVTCKGVTGTLTQARHFLKRKGNLNKYYFGESRIRMRPDKRVRIDCLEDSFRQFTFIYEQAEKLKHEYTNSGIESE